MLAICWEKRKRYEQTKQTRVVRTRQLTFDFNSLYQGLSLSTEESISFQDVLPGAESVCGS